MVLHKIGTDTNGTGRVPTPVPGEKKALTFNSRKYAEKHALTYL